MNYLFIFLAPWLFIRLTAMNFDQQPPSLDQRHFETEYLCDDPHCPLVFSTKKECRSHYLFAHPVLLNQKNRSECPFRGCPYTYVRETHLNNHFKRIHLMQPFECAQCNDGKLYRNFVELKIHLKQHR